jgi:RNA polymerase sigma factor (sigma-70 family)
MLAYALRRSRDTHEAQDWVAETFLVVWRRIDSLPPDVEVRPWLYGVIRRVAANRYRSQARREAVRQRLMSRPESVADVHANAVEREELRHVVEGLLGLKEPDREILLLAAWERLSTAEIAVVLDCSDNAAAIRLHRARRRLGEAVEKSIGPNAHGDMEAPRQLPKSKGGQWLLVIRTTIFVNLIRSQQTSWRVQQRPRLNRMRSLRAPSGASASSLCIAALVSRSVA